MVFVPDPIPRPDTALDSGVAYIADVPFDYKQSSTSTRRHRWFQLWEIGTPTGAYSSTRGLGVGATQRIQFDQKPDWIMVSISGETVAATGRCVLYLGEVGGVGIRLGPLGKAVVPSPQGGIVNLVNVGTTPTYGLVAAVAGFSTDPPIEIVCGS